MFVIVFYFAFALISFFSITMIMFAIVKRLKHISLEKTVSKQGDEAIKNFLEEEKPFNNTNKCAYCGTVINESVDKCSGCGAPLLKR